MKCSSHSIFLEVRTSETKLLTCCKQCSLFIEFKVEATEIIAKQCQQEVCLSVIGQLVGIDIIVHTV